MASRRPPVTPTRPAYFPPTSIFPSRPVPLKASHTRWRVLSVSMWRTMAPGVGIGTTSIFSVLGSKATMCPVRDSQYQIRPSVPMAIP